MRTLNSRSRFSADGRIPARKLPLWAQRLDRTMTDLRHVRYPATPEEGLQQALALADLGWRQILDCLRRSNPVVPDQELTDRAYQMVSDWQRIRNNLIFRRL
ncbi:MAG: hypothetical protein ACREIH_10745 [Nitrospiraceae bacterium]